MVVWDGEGFLTSTDESDAAFLQRVTDSPGGW